MSDENEFMHFDISLIDDANMYFLQPFDCTDSHKKRLGDDTIIPSQVDSMHLYLKAIYPYIDINEDIYSKEKPYLRRTYKKPGTIDIFRADEAMTRMANHKKKSTTSKAELKHECVEDEQALREQLATPEQPAKRKSGMTTPTSQTTSNDALPPVAKKSKTDTATPIKIISSPTSQLANPRRCGTIVYAYCRWAPGAAGVFASYYQQCNWNEGDTIETPSMSGTFDDQDHRDLWMGQCLMQLQQYTDCVYVTEKTLREYKTVFDKAKTFCMTVVGIRDRANVYFSERMSMEDVAREKRKLREEERKSRRDEDQLSITTFLETT